MATKKATTTTTHNTYGISAKVSAEIMVEISADSWESVLEQAREFKFATFASPEGDVNEEFPVQIQSIFLA